jgi:hypothetical protein
VGKQTLVIRELFGQVNARRDADLIRLYGPTVRLSRMSEYGGAASVSHRRATGIDSPVDSAASCPRGFLAIAQAAAP